MKTLATLKRIVIRFPKSTTVSNELCKFFSILDNYVFVTYSFSCKVFKKLYSEDQILFTAVFFPSVTSVPLYESPPFVSE